MKTWKSDLKFLVKSLGSKAACARYLGVVENGLQAWLSGKYKPSEKSAVKIAAAVTRRRGEAGNDLIAQPLLDTQGNGNPTRWVGSKKLKIFAPVFDVESDLRRAIAESAVQAIPREQLIGIAQNILANASEDVLRHMVVDEVLG